MPFKTREGYREWCRRYRAKNYAPAIPERAGVGVLHQYNLGMGLAQPLRIAVPKHGLKIAFIPDTQVMAGVPMEHLTWAGKYIAAKRPDVIVCIGDFVDLPSLNRHSKPLEREGARYANDIGAGRRAMDRLMAPIARCVGYDPWMEFTLGNHEDFVDRYVREHPEQKGYMDVVEDLGLRGYGWRVHPFMQPIEIGGVAFCHYFPSGVRGEPITTARALLAKLHMSAVAGHLQGKDIAYARRADGGHMAAIISGSFYQHNYKYLSPFTNAHWRGMWMLHEVMDGRFDELPISMGYLKRRFG